jgi:toxin ParE1/3/4
VAHAVIILDSAKEEFKDIKRYVKKEFGDAVWNTVNTEYKLAIQRIKATPELGSAIDQLTDLGVTHVKYTLVRQTKIVYEFDENQVLVHMFIHTKRDFRTHLFKRLLGQ